MDWYRFQPLCARDISIDIRQVYEKSTSGPWRHTLTKFVGVKKVECCRNRIASYGYTPLYAQNISFSFGLCFLKPT